MVIPSIYWHPEVVRSGSSAYVTTPPLGLPDFRYLKDKIYGTLRPRVFLASQVGPTCLFFAASRIAPCEEKELFFKNQRLVALFFAAVASLEKVFSLPMSNEIKEAIYYLTMANVGLFLFFQERFFQKVVYDFLNYPCRLYCFTRMDKTAIRAHCKAIIEEAKSFAIYVQHRVCMEKMGLFIHPWEPSDGLKALIPVLKTHLYLLVIGKFGTPFFQKMYQVEVDPSLGPILSGRLKPCYEKGGGNFNHAILIIGIEIFSKYRGFIYFIDPNDGSGPGKKQPVYRIKAIDFLRRIADVDGRHQSNPFFKKGHFIWVANPSSFLC